MKEDIVIVKNKFEDYFLSEEDREAINRALMEEKEEKLATKADVFD